MMTTKRKYSPSISLHEPLKKGQVFTGSLVMQAGKGNFSYAIYDHTSKSFTDAESFNLQRITGSEELSSTVRDIIRANDHLVKKFRSVAFQFISNRCTLVPNALYDDASKKDYLELNHFPEENETILADKLNNPEARNIYYFPKNLETNLGKLFPSVQIRHQASLLIEAFLSGKKETDEQKVFLHIQPDQFEMIVSEGKKLKLFNSFRYQSTEDFIYFVMFIIRQLKLDPEKISVEVYGEIERGSAMYAVLQKYIRHAEFGRLNVPLAPSLRKLPAHFFFSLLSYPVK